LQNAKSRASDHFYLLNKPKNANNKAKATATNEAVFIEANETFGKLGQSG